MLSSCVQWRSDDSSLTSGIKCTSERVRVGAFGSGARAPVEDCLAAHALLQIVVVDHVGQHTAGR